MTEGGQKLRRILGRFDLTLLLVVAVVNLVLVPDVARRGLDVNTLWLLAIVVFFVPQTIAILEMASRFPQEGGIYVWTKVPFGEFHGFLSGWCYWTNNLIYVPLLLRNLAMAVLYIWGYQDPTTQNLAITVITVLLLWGIVAVNYRGLDVGKWFHRVGVVGTLVSITVLVVLSYFVYRSAGSANQVTGTSLIPHIHQIPTLKAFGLICFALVGLELGSVMGEEIKKPRRSIPKAVLFAAPCCLLLYIAVTFATQILIPIETINQDTGLLQALDSGLKVIHFGVAFPIFGAIVIVGLIGAISAWVGGPARIPFVIGIDRLLPSSFGKIHPRFRTPYVAVVAEGFASTLVLLVASWGSRGEEAFTILLSSAVILQMIPFLYLFAALIRVTKSPPLFNASDSFFHRSRLCQVAGVIGFGVTTLSIGVALVPDEGKGWFSTSELKLVGCCAAFLVGAGFFYLRWRRSQLNRV